MKLIEKHVYVVGYKKQDNDEWETSGKVYGNLQDANWNCYDMGVKTGAITQVFEFMRPMPISGDIKKSEKLKEMIQYEY